MLLCQTALLCLQMYIFVQLLHRVTSLTAHHGATDADHVRDLRHRQDLRQPERGQRQQIRQLARIPADRADEHLYLLKI